MGRLLEVFKDVEVVVEGAAMNGKYRTLTKVEPRADARKVELKDLRDYVERLNERYSDRRFFVKKVKRDGFELYVLDQLTHVAEDLEALNARMRKMLEAANMIVEEAERVKGEFEEKRKEYEVYRVEMERILRRSWLIRWIWHFRLKKLKGKVMEWSEMLKAYEEKVARLNERHEELKAEIEALKEQISRGGVKEVRGRLPIYFDLHSQRVYVDEDDYKVEPKLSNYILMRTLGALGVSQTRHVKVLGRVQHG